MIKAIFFSVFDVSQGPKVLHQVPADSVTSSALSTSSTLFHFPTYSHYLIPRPDLCSRLITFTTRTHRILSHPICLPSSSYPRNAYTFSFALVLAATTPFASYATVTLKLASLLKTLEEQSRFLSSDQSAPNTGKIYALCEILLEDLNNYSESMIPIDDTNTLNIKLFPSYPPPPPLFPYHVPLSTVDLAALTDPNWDLTMLRVLPHIDGVNSMKQIALLADADYKLVRKAIEHLLYHGCLLLLDIFSFGAIYAPTAEIGTFVGDKEMQEECAQYVTLPFGRLGRAEEETVAGNQLVELYLRLRQGLMVKSFCMEHEESMKRIDVRRFITFGVIKGFLYRVHRYAIVASPKRVRKLDTEQRRNPGSVEAEDMLRQEEYVDVDIGSSSRMSELGKFLDGRHSFDEICTELMISERELMVSLKAWGDIQIICR
ncbi:MAG: hypothetical protein LQ342_000506 [Letrouitia transgressa]|nr:MAG: hypothetical protein LQ342_000506 [Letrouitia transgressa]